jgi:glycosyltransferase involved in cell wall biosynthesis
MLVIKKLSIIIPVYNEANNIENAIKSVVDVSLPNGIEREIIVVDDASKDGTRSVLERIEKQYQEKHVSIYYHPQNRGK